MSCASDYYAYCSQHSPGSPEVRKCMRAAGPKLSKGCIDALIADGEVSKAEVDRQRERYASAKAKPKPSEPAKKADVAALKKPEVEGKKAPKVAAVAPERTTPPTPKIVTSRRPETKATTAEIAETSTGVPTRATVKLDETIYAALKSRGDRFILDDDASTGVASQAAETTSPPAAEEAVADAPAAIAPQPDTVALTPPRVESSSWQAATPKQARLTPSAPSQDADDVTLAPAPVASADGTPQDAAARTVQYPPGRMSLGRNLATTDADKSGASWWDKIVQTVTGE